MGYGTRVFLVVECKIRRIGVDRFSRISSEALPEYAGQRIPYAILFVLHSWGRTGVEFKSTLGPHHLSCPPVAAPASS